MTFIISSITSLHRTVSSERKIISDNDADARNSFHAAQAIEYGTKVVGGINPKKAGTTHLDRPVFANVADAMKETGGLSFG